MRSKRAAQQVVSVMDVRYPIAQRLVDRVFQRACARVHGDDFSAKQSHSENIERLAPYIFCAHVDDAPQTEQCANRARGDAVLPCAGLRNDALFSHSARQQCLACGIIDLMRAGVEKIFAF